MMYFGWLGNSGRTLFGTGIVYVGGVPDSIKTPDYLPIRRSLEVDFESFLINLVYVYNMHLLKFFCQLNIVVFSNLQ